MRGAIMQPTFFPWAGYFNLISRTDAFVFLDDVQLEKQSWQTRNRILLNGEPSWISAPVMHQNLQQKICEVEVSEKTPWRTKLLRTLTQGYARHPYRDEMLEVAKALEELRTPLLADLNIGLIMIICEKLGIAGNFSRSGDMGISGERSERLIGICEQLKCDEYLSPAGSRDYLAEDRFVERTAVRLMFQDYTPEPYPQPKTTGFVSHLSILDVAASLGWERAAEYVGGRQE